MSTVKNRPATAKPKNRRRTPAAPPARRANLARRAAPVAAAVVLAVGVGAFAVLGSNPNITGAVPAGRPAAPAATAQPTRIGGVPVPGIGTAFFAKGAKQGDEAAVEITKAAYQGTGPARVLVLDITWTSASGTTAPDPAFFKVTTAKGAPAAFHPLATGQITLAPVPDTTAGKLAYTVGDGDATVTVTPEYGNPATFPVHG